MALHVLNARAVEAAGDGDHSDGGGLILRVRGQRAAWVFRFTGPSGKRRDAGFGIAHRDSTKAAGESLRLAREKAKHARDMLARGADPLDEKRARKQADTAATVAKKAKAKAEHLTLCRAARDYFDRAVEGRLNVKTAATWLSSLEKNLPSSLWHKPLAEITHAELFEAIAKVKRTKTVTALKMRRRLSAIFEDAMFFGRATTNPADAIRRKLRDEVKGKDDGEYLALDFSEVPAFVTKLREQKGTAATALEFALQTAARTGEVLGLTWDEIDEQTGVWTVPAARMKGKEDHTVYLPARALQIVQAMKAHGSNYLFPSPVATTKPLSNMSMLTVLRRMGFDRLTTVHGLCRASFSTWANDTAAARPDVIEACLAHKEGDRVRRAYNRASFAAERAALLRAWADYCDGKKADAPEALAPSAPVIPMQRAA